jgi:hypothetical protein
MPTYYGALLAITSDYSYRVVYLDVNTLDAAAGIRPVTAGS